MLITQTPALIWENRRGVGLVGVDGFWDNGGMGAFANCKSPMRIGMFWFQTIGAIPWLRRRALADLRITKVVIKLSVRKFQSVLRLVGMTEISDTLPPSYNKGGQGLFYYGGSLLGAIMTQFRLLSQYLFYGDKRTVPLSPCLITPKNPF